MAVGAPNILARAVVVTAGLPGLALADDKALHAHGLVMPKVEFAERDQNEGEFDECLDAFEDDQKALTK